MGMYQRTHGLYPVSDDVVKAAIEHAWAEYPDESCGLAYEDEYVAIRNVHDKPKEEFAMDPAQFAAVIAEKGDPVAVLHSHPGGPDHPTYHDAIAQYESGLPWGIISLEGRSIRDIFFWGDDVAIAPYEGRPFKHNVYDCFALARDFQRKEFGITTIPNYPREPKWWDKKDADSMFMSRFTEAGFEEVDFNGMKRGDCLLMSIRAAGVINHCGVYTGGDGMLHHLYGGDGKMMVSSHDNLYVFKRFVRHVFRHKDLQVPAK
jgi:proteasome lid subunit RPN8/RPN11